MHPPTRTNPQGSSALYSEPPSTPVGLALRRRSMNEGKELVFVCHVGHGPTGRKFRFTSQSLRNTTLIIGKGVSVAAIAIVERKRGERETVVHGVLMFKDIAWMCKQWSADLAVRFLCSHYN